MSYDIHNLHSLTREKNVRIEGREHEGRIHIVIEMKTEREELILPVMEVQWDSHLHRPAEPLHPNIVEMIARRTADLARAAYDAGYERARYDIRQALGVKAR